MRCVGQCNGSLSGDAEVTDPADVTVGSDTAGKNIAAGRIVCAYVRCLETAKSVTVFE